MIEDTSLMDLDNALFDYAQIIRMWLAGEKPPTGDLVERLEQAEGAQEAVKALKEVTKNREEIA